MFQGSKDATALWRYVRISSEQWDTVERHGWNGFQRSELKLVLVHNVTRTFRDNVYFSIRIFENIYIGSWRWGSWVHDDPREIRRRRPHAPVLHGAYVDPVATARAGIEAVCCPQAAANRGRPQYQIT